MIALGYPQKSREESSHRVVKLSSMSSSLGVASVHPTNNAPMPELPEVEHLRTSLVPLLIGLQVQRAQILRPDICERVDASGVVIMSRRARERRATEVRVQPHELLAGSRITSLERRGKQLFIIAEASACVLGVHLGMSGQLYFVRDGEQSPVKPFASGTSHIHARWHLTHADGSPAGELCFRDPRRFGALTLYPHAQAMHAWLRAHLGPDALHAKGDELFGALHTSSRMIKAALLDQGVIAGVGNIYADEALFRARIRPQLRCNKLTQAQADTLAMHLRALLAQAVAAGGSTLRDYIDGQGNAGNAQQMHAVYGRAGKPCTACGDPLRQGVLAQRTTVWCGTCQKGPGKTLAK